MTEFYHVKGMNGGRKKTQLKEVVIQFNIDRREKKVSVTSPVNCN